MRVDFVLCYEFWQRELYALTLTRVRLEDMGYKIKILHISPDYNDFFEMYYYKPKVVVFPWVYSDMELERATDFIGDCPKVVNMQCEQILSKRVLDNGFFSIRENARKIYHVSWGRNTTERFRKYGIDEDHILEIGNINLEINKSKYDKYFISKEELAHKFGLNINKKWFLFSSNFKFPNRSLGELANFEKRSAGVFRLTSEMIRSKKAILNWIIKYLDENDDIEIIYRPHPIENKDSYLLYIEKKYKNFHYIGDFTINQWVRVCERCSTWISTAILDSIFINIPSAVLLPYPLLDIFRGDIDGICKEVRDYESFVCFIKEDNIRKNNYSNVENKIKIKSDGIEEFVEKLISVYKNDEKEKFEKQIKKEKKWKNTTINEKYKMFEYWLSKYINISKKNPCYVESYKIKKIEKKLYKMMKRFK